MGGVISKSLDTVANSTQEVKKRTGLFSNLGSDSFSERAGSAALGQTAVSAVQRAADPTGTSTIASTAGGGASGALMGAALTTNPAGAVIGGVLGGLSGLFGSASRRAAQAQERQKAAAQILAKGQLDQNFTPQFRFGSRRESFEAGRRLKI